MQIVIVQCARAIDLLTVNFGIKEYNKVSMTAAEGNAPWVFIAVAVNANPWAL